MPLASLLQWQKKTKLSKIFCPLHHFLSLHSCKRLFQLSFFLPVSENIARRAAAYSVFCFCTGCLPDIRRAVDGRRGLQPRELQFPFYRRLSVRRQTVGVAKSAAVVLAPFQLRQKFMMKSSKFKDDDDDAG